MKKHKTGDRLFDEDEEVFDPVQKSIQIIRAVEVLEGEKSELGLEIKNLFDEAKDYGLNVEAIKLVIRRRRKTRYERDELDQAVDEVEAVLADRSEDLGYDDII